MLVEFFILIALVTLLCYFYIQKSYRYWEEKGVPYVQPTFPYGTLKVGKGRLHSSQSNDNYYRKFKGSAPFCGLYFMIKPAVLALDIEFIKHVLITDFQYFHDRGVFYNEKIDPLAGHIFNLEGARWRKLRNKLTPTFTSGKMKYMFPTMISVALDFIATLQTESEVNNEIEMKDILARFTTDVIGSCAFGLECNSLKDPNNIFRQMGKNSFEAPRNSRAKQFLLLAFKPIGRLLSVKTVREDVSQFFLNIVYDTVEYRESNNIQRNDFMDLLIKLKNSNSIDEQLTLNEIAAQAFVFFLAGFETSSTAMSFALYELARNQVIQDKARKCVQEVVAKHSGNITYEAINEMTYIDHCINESLRKYPPGAMLIRETTKDYNYQGYQIEKGTLLLVPVYSIHHDEQFYKDPEEYRPERFEPSESSSRHPVTFIPFGEGPRICIGLRFGMMQARIGLAMLLNNYKFRLSSKTPVPLKFSNSNIVLTPADGLWLNVEKI